MRRVILWLVVLIILPISLMAQSENKGMQFYENKTWSEILSLSKLQQKLIFLDCYTSWCAPCKAMAMNVFPQEKVGKYMNEKFINVKFDMEKGEGIDLYKKYKPYIPGFPTYLLINSEGKVVHQFGGYYEADVFISNVEVGLNQNSWISLEEKYESGQRDFAFVRAYLSALESAYQKGKIDKVVADILPKINEELLSNDSNAYRIFRKYSSSVDNPLVYKLLTSPGIFRRYKDPEQEVNEWGSRLYQSAVNKFIEASSKSSDYDNSQAEKLIEELRNLYIPQREIKIGMMLLSQAVAKLDANSFLNLYEYGNEFGLFRNNAMQLSKWAKYLSSNTTDVNLLKKYLQVADFDEEKEFLAPSLYQNYGFILQKLGRDIEAKDFFNKAKAVETEFNEKFKGLINNK